MKRMCCIALLAVLTISALLLNSTSAAAAPAQEHYNSVSTKHHKHTSKQRHAKIKHRKITKHAKVKHPKVKHPKVKHPKVKHPKITKHHKITKHPKVTKHAPPLPRTCTPLVHRRGQFPVIDEGSAVSALTTDMQRLVCTAADNAVIDVRSWFFFEDSAPIRLFVADLKLMHRYHHDEVNLMVGHNFWQTRHVPGYKALLAEFHGWAHVYDCGHACLSTRTNSVNHPKWVSVSRLRTGGPGLLNSSSNFSKEQFGESQSGIMFLDEPGVSRLFSREWNTYVRCATGRACDRTPRDRTWESTGEGVRVYFAPTTSDPLANLLNNVDCSHGGSITGESLWLTRKSLVEALQTLHRNGCTVHLLVSHQISATIPSVYLRRYRQHDKFLLISTPTQHTLIAGSEEFGAMAEHVNDNVMIQTHSPRVLAAFTRHFATSWRLSTPCTIISPTT